MRNSCNFCYIAQLLHYLDNWAPLINAPLSELLRILIGYQDDCLTDYPVVPVLYF